MNNLALIGTRLLALYLFVSGLTKLISILPMWNMITSQANSLSTLLSLSLPTLAGLILWLVAPWVAIKLAGKKMESKDPANDVQFIAAGSFLMGLYLLITQLPLLVTLLAQSHPINTEIQLISLSIKLVLAIGLMMGSNLLKKLFITFKNFG